MFNLIKKFFSRKTNKLEEDLVETTILMLGLLTDMKNQGKITEAVYNSEIEKKVAFLKSLNKNYESILKGEKEEVKV